MKTTVFSFVLILMSQFSHAQADQYRQAMAGAMQQMARAQTANDLLEVSNTFERISLNADGEYLPAYYAALNSLNRSWRLEDKAEKETAIDHALELVNNAREISPNNSEVEVMRGYALMAKMVVDPQSRGQSYSPQIMQAYGKAIALDSLNPRAWAMMARMELGSAQFFGTEPKEACAKARKSLQLFERESPVGFEPRWGNEIAGEVLQSCK